jgi:hypothetical protein
MERDPEKVRILYEQGRQDALKAMPALTEWMNK